MYWEKTTDYNEIFCVEIIFIYWFIVTLLLSNGRENQFSSSDNQTYWQSWLASYVVKLDFYIKILFYVKYISMVYMSLCK